LVQIKGKIARNLKVWGQLGVKLKKFAANDFFEKKDRPLGIQLIEIKSEIKKIWKFCCYLFFGVPHKKKKEEENRKYKKSFKKPFPKNCAFLYVKKERQS
jgi:hypothetical protein